MGEPGRVGGQLSAGMFRARTPVEDAQEADAQESPPGAAHRPSKKPAGQKVDNSHHLQCSRLCLLCSAMSGSRVITLNLNPELQLPSRHQCAWELIYMACLPGKADA